MRRSRVWLRGLAGKHHDEGCDRGQRRRRADSEHKFDSAAQGNPRGPQAAGRWRGLIIVCGQTTPNDHRYDDMIHHMMINIWLFMATNATLVRAVALTLHRTTEIRSKTAPEPNMAFMNVFLLGGHPLRDGFGHEKIPTVGPDGAHIDCCCSC
jgi:hypothetical protein